MIWEDALKLIFHTRDHDKIFFQWKMLLYNFGFEGVQSGPAFTMKQTWWDMAFFFFFPAQDLVLMQDILEDCRAIKLDDDDMKGRYISRSSHGLIWNQYRSYAIYFSIVY